MMTASIFPIIGKLDFINFSMHRSETVHTTGFLSLTQKARDSNRELSAQSEFFLLHRIQSTHQTSSPFAKNNRIKRTMSLACAGNQECAALLITCFNR